MWEAVEDLYWEFTLLELGGAGVTIDGYGTPDLNQPTVIYIYWPLYVHYIYI